MKTKQAEIHLDVSEHLNKAEGKTLQNVRTICLHGPWSGHLEWKNLTLTHVFAIWFVYLNELGVI